MTSFNIEKSGIKQKKAGLVRWYLFQTTLAFYSFRRTKKSAEEIYPPPIFERLINNFQP